MDSDTLLTNEMIPSEQNVGKGSESIKKEKIKNRQ